MRASVTAKLERSSALAPARRRRSPRRSAGRSGQGEKRASAAELAQALEAHVKSDARPRDGDAASASGCALVSREIDRQQTAMPAGRPSRTAPRFAPGTAIASAARGDTPPVVVSRVETHGADLDDDGASTLRSRSRRSGSRPRVARRQTEADRRDRARRCRRDRGCTRASALPALGTSTRFARVDARVVEIARASRRATRRPAA